jgi:DNA-binding LytR/AlgR family response regulator
MMRVVVADDEPLALRGLMHLLAEQSDIRVVGTATRGDEALRVIDNERPDLVFLDIQMPSLTGLQVAAALGQGGPDIVFVTAFDGYAADAFAVEAVDYLLKPVQPERLWQSLQRARRRRVERDAYQALTPPTGQTVLHVPGRHGGTDVPQAEIVWIEAARDYGLIHTEHRSFILRTTMADLAEQLDESIVRVHRSAFVSISRVRHTRSVAKGTAVLVLDDGAEIPVGPSYAKAVRAALQARAGKATGE